MTEPVARTEAHELLWHLIDFVHQFPLDTDKAMENATDHLTAKLMRYYHQGGVDALNGLSDTLANARPRRRG